MIRAMQDIDRLRRRLWSVVTVAPIGLFACESAPSPSAADASPKEAAPSDAKPTANGPRDDHPPASDPNDPDATPQERGKASEPPTPKEVVEETPDLPDPSTHCSGHGRVLLTTSTARSRKRDSSATVLGCPESLSSSSIGAGMKVLQRSPTQAIRDDGNADQCCYGNVVARKGRLFVEGDSTWLPRFAVAGRWSDPDAEPSLVGLEAATRRRVGAGWLADAREEQAAVAAFERAALELRALEAPLSLIRAARRAAHDERRHAAACLRLARAYSRRMITLATERDIDPRQLDRLQLVCTTFVEGAVPETVAALVATRCCRRARPALRSTLAMIAEDETRHAQLAWATIAWGIAGLSASDQRRFLAFARGRRPVARTVSTPKPLHAHGRMDKAEQEAVAAQAWPTIIEPLLAQLDRQAAAMAMVQDASPKRRSSDDAALDAPPNQSLSHNRRPFPRRCAKVHVPD